MAKQTKKQKTLAQLDSEKLYTVDEAIATLREREAEGIGVLDLYEEYAGRVQDRWSAGPWVDRLRDAIARVAANFASGDALSQSVERIFSEASDALEGGSGSASVVGVQLRIASIDVAFTDDASGTSAFASVRQFALEVSVARGDTVAAEDVRVFTAEGRSAGLSVTDVRAGFTSGVYRRVEAGGGASALSEQARERLEAARAGLERVRAVQDALSAFRDGNEAPLRELFEGDSAIGQVFPGSGPLALNS